MYIMSYTSRRQDSNLWSGHEGDALTEEVEDGEVT